MKANYVAVCVVIAIVLGIAGFVGCSIYSNEAKKSKGRIENVVKLRLDYEQAIKKYESLDSCTWNYAEEKAMRLSDAEGARKEYLEAFANLTDNERTTYKTLEGEIKSADVDYLGSIYEDEDSADDAKFKPIQATYTNAIK